MNRYNQNTRKMPQSGLPISGQIASNKRPRVGSTGGESSGSKFAKNGGDWDEDDDDPFADDLITGEELEEWENIATQAEVQLTQGQSKQNGYQKNGSSHTGYTFKALSKASHGDSTNETNQKDSLVKDLQAKLAAYEKKVKELEQSYIRKDGETRILRDRLTRSEKDLGQEKFKMVEMQRQYADAEASKEKQIQKEIEKFKDQVQFKDAEMLESQNLIRNLEAKNKKLLESQKARSNINAPSSSKNNFHDIGWTNTDEGSGVHKKIRLVKPESPRIHVPLKKATFDDEPLGRKKPAKSSPTKPSTSTATATVDSRKTPEQSVCIASFAKMKLRSKYLSESHQGQSALKNLFGTNHGCQSSEYNVTDPPLLHLMSKGTTARDVHAQDGFVEGIRKLLSAPAWNSNSFRRMTGGICDDVNITESKGFAQLLLLIERALEAYATLLSDTAPGGSSSLEPSFYSAVSSTEKLAGEHVSTKSCVPRCERAYSAVGMLRVLLESSQALRQTVILKDQLSSHLLKLCDFRTWDPGLSHCKNITSCSLHAVRILVNDCKEEQQLALFSPLMKNEVLLPLIVGDDLSVSCQAIQTIQSLIRHHPFAVVLVTEDKAAESASLLYHACSLCWAGKYQDGIGRDALYLLSKVISLISTLVCEHESLLVEHSCYSEIYHSANVLLYNQLVLWKKDTRVEQKRINLIWQAICLLYSCTNVYTEGIPGNRHEHKHLVVATELEHFLSKHGDPTSFWCRELHRTVKSEVNSVFEEVEVT